ncbi:MAG: hypothetical protein IJF67_09480 [Clostridia bacterium]|nr:hypothetical protein [Clostridia bacterium]
MKKWFSLALAFLMLIAASCGGAGGSQDTTAASGNDTTAAPVTTELTDGLEDKNMEGFSLNILHHDDTWLTWAKTQLVADEENGDLINDTIYKRNSYIEDRFNAKINVTGVNQVASVFKQEVMSGDNNYDIIFQYGINVLGNVDLLADMNNIPYLNLDADHWLPSASSVFAIGKKQIALAGSWSLSYASGAYCFAFNKELYDSLQIKDNIYDLVRDGKWTTDKFFEIVAKGVADLNGDAKMDDKDRAGSTGSVKQYFNALIGGANIKYIKTDADGNPVFDVKGNTKTVDFMEKLLGQLEKEPFVFANTATSVDNGGGYDFKSGQSFFINTTPLGIEKMRDVESDFGIVPSPKYDEKQEKYYSQSNIGEIATLPRSYDESRMENVGMLMEAMGFYSQKNLLPAYADVAVSVKATRDDDSMEMLQIIFESISFDAGVVVWQNDVGNVYMKNVFMPRSNTIASTTESIATAMETKFQTLVEQLAEMP